MESIRFLGRGGRLRGEPIFQVMSAITSSRARSTGLVALVLALGIAAAYWESLAIGFYFDAEYGIRQNPAIRSLANIPSFFVDPYAVWLDRTQVDLRPLLLTSFAVNYAISGLEPWSYHALDLVLHWIAALLVFVIVRDHVWGPAAGAATVERRVLAAAVALAFALAPLNSQPVLYVWARSALLCVTLYLAAFLAFMRQRWWIGALCFVGALLTKAIAVTLPAVLLAYHLIYREDADRFGGSGGATPLWRRLVRPVGISALLALAYVAYRQAFLPAWTADARHAYWVTPQIWFMSQWSALLSYVRLFVWPEGLSIDHDHPYATRFWEFRAWGALVLLLVWVSSALKVVRSHPQVTFATAWFFITLSPESSVLPLAEVVNDHRPYIASSLGLSVLLVWVIDQGTRRLGTRRWLAFGLVTVVLSVAAVSATRHRTWVWGDKLRLWEATIAASPGNTRAWVNAGETAMSRGELEKARNYLNRGREVGPDYAWAYMNLSALDRHEGKYAAALRNAQEGLRLRPDHPTPHYWHGRALERLAFRDEALAAYRRAVELNPKDPVPREALTALEARAPSDEEWMAGGLYYRHTLRQPTKAVEAFREILRNTPTHYGATYQLAAALDDAGLPTAARPYWERALALALEINDQATIATASERLEQPTD